MLVLTRRLGLEGGSNKTEMSHGRKTQVTGPLPPLRKSAWTCASQRICLLESLVQTSCVETLDYSGYKHYHNYGLIATTLQLLPGAIECVVR